MVTIPTYLGRQCNLCGCKVRSASSPEVMVVEGFPWHKKCMDLQTIQRTNFICEPPLIVLDLTKPLPRVITPVEVTQRLIEDWPSGKKVMRRLTSAEALPGYMAMLIGVPVGV